ncbi:hypothetical protein DL96DRAFT_1615799 [Flagelloscypha sp. PMI_526]|nr:hypothetical protein DL96DRAFT_1615799 [Flagelloscypha sp. PMI_526]
MSVVSTAPPPVLPIEIVHIIIEFAFRSDPKDSQRLKFLLLSRSIYNWIFPLLYHSLDLKSSLEFGSSSWFVDRSILVSAAQPSSLLHTRYLISRNWEQPFSFAPFSNLSHLVFWGGSMLDDDSEGHCQAYEIVMLPLEELFVWRQTDSKILVKHITKETSIWTTIQRLGFFTRKYATGPQEGWMECPNLVQVFVLCASLTTFVQRLGPTIVLPSSPRFRSFILAPLLTIQLFQVQTLRDALDHVVKDRRIVVLYHVPAHMGNHRTKFWVNQGNMWRFLHSQVEKDFKIKEITVLEKDLLVTQVEEE